QGGASHFDDEWMMCANYTLIYRENGVRVHVPRGFFSSRFYTDKLIEQIDSAEDDKPFFAYLAYTAPHDPLHLPEEWLDKYRGRYDGGYDKLRAERLARMQKAGLVAADVQLSRRLAMMPPWDSLTAEQRRVAARKMELHAAMIENMDHHLGRLIKHLEQRGDLDNTLVIFFSDNGAAPTEVHNYPGTTKEWVERNSDNRFENMGRRGSRISIGLPWAVASNTPLRYFKGLITEGGIRVPLIVRGPGVKRGGQISAAFAHVTDLAPTILEVAGVTHPRRYKGRAVLPLRGKSLVPFLAGKADRIRSDQEPVGWEAFGYRAVRQGRWKATWLPQPLGSGDWQLFDLQRDPTERDDLAASQAAKLRELVAVYASYSKEVGVVLPSSAPRIGR
ncbi:MAG: sulfatase-like hydrolase/transferase, partial [Planctomycetota bacterium]